MKCVKCPNGFAFFDIDGEPICIPCFLYEPALEKPRKIKTPPRPRKPSNPQYAAHRLVAVAKNHGYLKPQPCEICGSTYAIHAHHEDYSKPLDVHWLCHRHHSEVTHKARTL